MNNVIGRCGNCGGKVRWPSMMVDPIPSCENCGAVPMNSRGPVIEMEPKGHADYVSHVCRSETTDGRCKVCGKPVPP